MMKKFVLALAAAFITSSSPMFAEKADVAAEIVSCINTANGHVEPVGKTRWYLTQAILVLPYEHERTRLADGIFFIGGRMLGYHGTWTMFLDVSESDWVAYETRDQDDELKGFAASFVPPEIITALGGCSVRWSGFWVGKFPFVVLDPPVVTPLTEEQRLPEDPFSDGGANLLPPVAIAD